MFIEHKPLFHVLYTFCYIGFCSNKYFMNHAKDETFEIFTALTEECRLLRYKNPSFYLTGDTLHLCYRDQPVNAM
jgi:hypothetical protein